MSGGPHVPDIRSLQDESWDQPARRGARPEAAPALIVDGWEGPLDWLLELARSRRIDIAKLPIAALVEAFAEALQEALVRRGPGAVALGTLGDWVVMAATLTLLRSRLLLPAEAAMDRAAHAEAEALRRQLVDRAAFAVAADWLHGRSQLGRDVYARGQPTAQHAREGRVGDITGLFRACLVLLELPWDAEAAYRLPPLPLWTVAQATERIRRMLALMPETTLRACLPRIAPGAADRDTRCRAAIAATFCGSLELARDQTLALRQQELWAAIDVHATHPSRAAYQAIDDP